MRWELTEDSSERAKRHGEMLAAALRTPDAVEATDVLGHWHRLDEVERKVKAGGPKRKIISMGDAG